MYILLIFFISFIVPILIFHSLFAFIIGIVLLTICALQKEQLKAAALLTGISGILSIVLISSIFLLGSLNRPLHNTLFNSASYSSSKNSSDDDVDTEDDSNSDVDDTPESTYTEITDVKCSDTRVYSHKFTNNTWSGASISIDKVTVSKTKKTEIDSDGKKFNGIVVMHVSINAKKDIDAYVSSLTIKVNGTGSKIENDFYDSDNFESSFKANTKQDGEVYFLIPKISSVNSVKTLKTALDASYQDDSDDDDWYKEYNFSVNLK